jgi:hypothetical protein
MTALGRLDPALPDAFSRLHCSYLYLPVILKQICDTAPRAQG